MEHNEAEILALLSSNGNSAADMTHALKEIGDGSMERGIKCIEEFLKEDAAILRTHDRMTGVLFGTGITAGVGVGVGLIIWLIKRRRARHEEKRKKIYEALESSDSIPSQEPDTDEVID